MTKTVYKGTRQAGQAAIHRATGSWQLNSGIAEGRGAGDYVWTFHGECRQSRIAVHKNEAYGLSMNTAGILQAELRRDLSRQRSEQC